MENLTTKKYGLNNFAVKSLIYIRYGYVLANTFSEALNIAVLSLPHVIKQNLYLTKNSISIYQKQEKCLFYKVVCFLNLYLYTMVNQYCAFGMMVFE